MSSPFVKVGTGLSGGGEGSARALMPGVVNGPGQPGASPVLPNYRLKLTVRGRSEVESGLRTRAAA